MSRHIKAKHLPYELLCPMPSCPGGIVRNGFTRKDRLVTHLINQSSDGKRSTGHGIPYIEAQKVAIDLDKRARTQEGGSAATEAESATVQERDGTTTAGEGPNSFTELLEEAGVDTDMDWENVFLESFRD